MYLWIDEYMEVSHLISENLVLINIQDFLNWFKLQPWKKFTNTIIKEDKQ